MRHITEKSNQHHFTFDSLADYLDYSMRECDLSESSRASRKVKNWSGGKTYNESVNMAFSGWKEGAEKVSELSAKFSKARAEEITASALVYDTAGAMVDVGVFMTGDPECMIDFAEQIQHKPVIKIGFDICVNAGIKPNEMVRKGAVMLALVEALEFAGVAVELHGFNFNEGNQSRSFFFEDIVFKRSDEPLDIDRMAFCMAFPGFLRQISFSAWENHSEQIRENHNIPNGGYGRTGSITDDLKKRYDYDLCPTYNPYDYDTTEKCLENLKKLAREAGVELEN